MLSVVAARLENRPEIPGLPLLVPLAALVFAALLTRWWRRGALTPNRCLLAAICCVYCVGLLRSVLFPYPLVVGSARTPQAWGDVLQLVPLATVPDDPSGMVLNIVLFVPLGALAGLLLRRPSVLRVVTVGLLVSLAIELTQLVGDLTISTGRIADVDDLIGNTVGAAVGFGLLRLAALLPVIARLETWLRSNPRANSAPAESEHQPPGLIARLRRARASAPDEDAGSRGSIDGPDDPTAALTFHEVPEGLRGPAVPLLVVACLVMLAVIVAVVAVGVLIAVGGPALLVGILLRA